MSSVIFKPYNTTNDKSFVSLFKIQTAIILQNYSPINYRLNWKFSTWIEQLTWNMITFLESYWKKTVNPSAGKYNLKLIDTLYEWCTFYFECVYYRYVNTCMVWFLLWFSGEMVISFCSINLNSNTRYCALMFVYFSTKRSNRIECWWKYIFEAAFWISAT